MMTGFTIRLPLLPTVIAAVFLLVGASTFLGMVAEGTSPIAMNPERRQLLEDTLYRMTFMQNGTYASRQTVNALFLRQILERYKRSKFYRSFVIAFQYGVIPRLIIPNGVACHPQLVPRDPSNMSLTWHYLKNLTFDSYRDRHLITADIYDPTNKFCDYRQGLICRPDLYNPLIGTCTCPYGSQHTDITQYDPANPNPQPSVLRCLVNHGSPCALIDLDHGNDPKHSALAANMHHLMFNFDRPIPCIKDTQCRFKDTDLSTPKCYNHYEGPFHPPPPFPNGTVETWTLKLGAACTIGLYADPGSCEVNTNQKYGVLPGLVCYNFGVRGKEKHKPLHIVEHREGFCAHELGQYGLVSVATSANGQLHIYPLFIPYVHPRTVPLRDDKLLSYYDRFLNKVHRKLFLEGVQREVGESCDVKRTTDFYNIFLDYYVKKVGKIPKNSDHSPAANDNDLEDNLKNVIALADDAAKGVCRVFPYHYRASPGSNRELIHPVDCVKKRPTARKGRCESRTVTENAFETYADNLADFLDRTSLIQLEQEREEFDVDEDILRDNPETFCTPGPSFRYVHGTPLENGVCPQGFFCYKDYGDHQKDIYDASCKLDTALALNFSCHEVRDGIDYGKCEVDQLEKMISQNIPAIEAASNLGLGDTCVHKVERGIRSWIRDGKNGITNKYKVLAIAETVVSSKRVFCNATRLLECTSENKCECVESTAPRRFPDDDNGIEGDYCYLTKGSCSEIDLSKFVPLTSNELGTASDSYGESKDTPGNFCKGNLCWHLDTDREICREREGTGDKDKGTGPGFAGVADLRGKNEVTLVSCLAVIPFFI